MTARLAIDKDALRAFCHERCIRRLSLFGSVLRDDFGPASDIDVLVEFDAGVRPSLLSLAALEQELGAVFGGRKVDLGRPEDLHPALAPAILKTAEIQYDGA